MKPTAITTRLLAAATGLQPTQSARGAAKTRLQKGSVLPLIVVALTAIIAMGGLAIDLGHVYVSRTRLQNAVDAAALSAAREFELRGENTSSTVRTNATTAATTAFGNIMTSNPDSARTVSAPTVTFATALAGPYSGSASPAYFMRVSASASLPPWFTRIVRNANLTMDASAVSGTIAANKLCDLLPVAFCGGATYHTGTVYTMAYGSGASGYMNLNLESSCGNNGAACIRQHMAGAYTGCATVAEFIEIKTGNNSGPNQQGINTRFGDSAPQVDPQLFPADFNTTENVTYVNYLTSNNNKRRVVNIAVADCGSGQDGNVQVKAVATFFLTKRATNKAFFGEFVGISNGGTVCMEGVCEGKIVLMREPGASQ